MESNQQLSSLVASLGFTDLESEIYVFLLRNSPATGYKIAKSIHRSFTNTYKALDSLIDKEAILPDQGSVSLYRAVRIEDLLEMAEKEFKQKKKLLLKAAEQMPAQPDDRGIYHLTSVKQVYEKANAILDQCEERVLLELFPDPFKRLSAKLQALTAKGIVVCSRVYQKEQLDGIHLVHSPFGDQVIRDWNTNWMAIFIDGKQFLIAHMSLDNKGVYDAIWSANPFLSRAVYSHVNSDLHLYTILNQLKTGDSFHPESEWFERAQALFPVGGDIGFKELKRYFNPEKGEEKS